VTRVQSKSLFSEKVFANPKRKIAFGYNKKKISPRAPTKKSRAYNSGAKIFKKFLPRNLEEYKPFNFLLKELSATAP